jgi:hypothetical protein
MPFAHFCSCFREVARLKNFLGLDDPNDFMNEAAAMKRKGDFTRPTVDLAAIEKVRGEGMVADKWLSVDTLQEGEAAAR